MFVSGIGEVQGCDIEVEGAQQHLTRSRDCIRVTFVCHWVAHMHRESMGNCIYTVYTLYEHVW